MPLSRAGAERARLYTVKRGDTLWGISELFLKSPWRWPELWGMNLDADPQPAPDLSRARCCSSTRRTAARACAWAQPVGGGTATRGCRRACAPSDIALDGIASIPFHLIEPFLNEAVIFETNELAAAPRIVATQEGRVLLSRGDTAYVRGELGAEREFRIFREPRPLLDPTTSEVLGYEATYVGAAEYTVAGRDPHRRRRQGRDRPGHLHASPASARKPASATAWRRCRRASSPTTCRTRRRRRSAGQIVSIYGDALTAGQNQIVAINRGARDGIERGHVLALWRDGEVVDRPDRREPRPTIKLPDERHGLLFVFRVFERMSYALILSVKEPVTPGDRFTQP